MPWSPGAALIALVGCCVAILFAGCASITPPRAGESIRRDLVYAHRPTGDLHLDLYLPASAAPVPLLIWFHGGGWQYGGKGWMLYLRDLTRDGLAVASVQYRLSGTARYPAQLEDCREALQWLQQHGGDYGLRTRPVFLGGASAGGHLAALLGVKEGSATVGAVCALYPATDLLGFRDHKATKGHLPSLLGGSVAEKSALAKAASPIRFVSHHSPAFLFFHGDGDKLVPVAQSISMHRKLIAAGVESHLVVLHGRAHGFGLTDSQVRETALFLRRHLHRERPIDAPVEGESVGIRP